MQFMLMCAINETDWNALADEDRARVMDDYHAWVARQAADGRYLGGGKLEDSATAVSLREHDGRVRATDGPFAEAREQIGGYHILECRDRDEAAGFARQIPTLAVGGVIEIRALRPDR